MGKLLDITDATFEREVLKSVQPALVDFWATWCGPCKQMGPILEKLDTRFRAKIKIVKVNVDIYRPLASKYNVQSIPTMIFFKEGKEVERIVGYQYEKTLEDMINRIAR